METTESVIPPFVFVDGRKYVLAETEERPEPEILKKISPPPRMISHVVQWLVRLNYGQEMMIIVLSIGCFFSAGAIWLAMENDGVFLAFSVFIIPVLPFFFPAVYRFYSRRKQIQDNLWLMEHGNIGKGRFYRICPSGKKFYNALEMELTYQFTIYDGNTFHAKFYTTDYYRKKNLPALTDESFRLVFYDAEEPRRNMLFDSLPQGITFDDCDQTFNASSMILFKQIASLIVCFALVPLSAALLLYALN